jgi:hypothetical protein
MHLKKAEHLKETYARKILMMVEGVKISDEELGPLMKPKPLLVWGGAAFSLTQDETKVLQMPPKTTRH